MVHCATHLHHCKYTICETKCEITTVKYCVLHTLKKKPCNVRKYKKQKLSDLRHCSYYMSPMSILTHGFMSATL